MPEFFSPIWYTEKFLPEFIPVLWSKEANLISVLPIPKSELGPPEYERILTLSSAKLLILVWYKLTSLFPVPSSSPITLVLTSVYVLTPAKGFKPCLNKWAPVNPTPAWAIVDKGV